MDVDGGAGRRGEATVTGDVVGVVVCLEHVIDAHAEIARELEVVVDLEPWVDHGRRTGGVVADEVRGAAEVVVRDLAEDHLPPIISCRLERVETDRSEREKPVAPSARTGHFSRVFPLCKWVQLSIGLDLGVPQSAYRT